MNKYKLFTNKYSLFTEILLYILIPTFLLTIIDYRLVINDGEPDYLANAYSVYNYLIPFNSHHPGTITYYFYGLLVFFLEYFELDLTSSILLLRFFGIFVGLSIIYYLNIKNKITVSLFLILIFSIPYINWVYSHIGPEALLVPLTFYLIYLTSHNKNFLLITFILGLLLNIKLSIIVIYPLFFFYLVINKYNFLKIIFIFIISLLIFLFLSLPVIANLILPLNRSYEEIIFFYNIFISKIPLLNLNIYIMPILFISALIVFLIIYSKSLIKHKINLLIYQILIYLFIFVFILFFFFRDGSYVRHFIPVIPFITLFLSELLFFKSKLSKYIVNFTLLIIYLINFNLNDVDKNHSEIDKIFQQSKEKIFIFQESQFNSQILFLTWGKYRYAKSYDIWPNRWNKLTSNIEYLNTRNIKCSDKKDILNNFYIKSEIVKSDYTKNYDKCFINQIEEIKNKNLSIFLYDNTSNKILFDIFMQNNINIKMFNKYLDFTEYKIY